MYQGQPIIIILAVLFLWEIGCNEEIGSNSESDDLDTLNFDVFQETSGEGVCPGLVDPTHGYFECKESRDLGISRRVEANKTCTLRCNDGYTLPLVYDKNTGKSMLIEDSGVYRCFSNMAIAGRRHWTPSQFYDCTRRKDPLECKLYFYVSLKWASGDCSAPQEDTYAEEFGKIDFDTNDICQNLTLNCTWIASFRCPPKAKVMKAVITLSWPFANDVVGHRKKLSESFLQEGDKIGEIKPKTNPIFRYTSFQVTCPRGTRFAQDLACHGCSKGHFMNESTMLCQPCPHRFFQDRDLQYVCKPCPEGSQGFLRGGAHITSCFKMHELLQETDLLTMTFCVGTVVSFVFIVLIFNKQVQREAEEEMQAEESLAVDKPRNPNLPISEPIIVMKTAEEPQAEDVNRVQSRALKSRTTHTTFQSSEYYDYSDSDESSGETLYSNIIHDFPTARNKWTIWK